MLSHALYSGSFTFVAEVKIYNVRRDVAYVWWFVSRLRAAVFPMSRHHNWSGKHLPRWVQVLGTVGFDARHIIPSDKAARAGASQGCEVDLPSQDYMMSTQAVLVLCLYWEHRAQNEDSRMIAESVFEAIIAKTIGSEVFPLCVRVGGNVHTIWCTNGAFVASQLRVLGDAFKYIVNRAEEPGTDLVSVRRFLGALLDALLRPSRLRSLDVAEGQLVFTALCSHIGFQVDDSRHEAWWQNGSCLALTPIAGNKRCRRISQAYVEAVLEEVAGDSELESVRSFVAAQGALAVAKSGADGKPMATQTVKSAYAMVTGSIFRYWCEMRELLSPARALQFCLDGVRAGGEETLCFWGYAPEEKLGCVPPPQVRLGVSKPSLCLGSTR